MGNELEVWPTEDLGKNTHQCHTDPLACTLCIACMSVLGDGLLMTTAVWVGRARLSMA